VFVYQVPTIAAVENMAYFDCDAGKRYFPFGKGHMDLVKVKALSNQCALSGSHICKTPDKAMHACIIVHDH
jgi:hypothetical protein